MEVKYNNRSPVIEGKSFENKEKKIMAIKKVKQVLIARKTQQIHEEILFFFSGNNVPQIEFLYQETFIASLLLDQLSTLDLIPGGLELQTGLLPIYVKFCQTDERELAFKSLEVIQKIVKNNSKLFLETVQQLLKPKMVVSVQIGVILISHHIGKFKNFQSVLIELYEGIISNSEPSLRICACRHLGTLTESLNDKEKICKILDHIFDDKEELPKLLSIKALVLLYGTNSNFALSKLKILFCQENWRINIKLCQQFVDIQKYLKKFHFKSLAQPAYLKMLTSEDEEVRAAACSSIVGLSKYMSHQEAFNTLFPILIKLCVDKQRVKQSLSDHILQLIPEFPKDKTREKLIPLILNFLEENKQSCFEGMIQNLKFLSDVMEFKDFKSEILSIFFMEANFKNWRYVSKLFGYFEKLIEKCGSECEGQIFNFVKSNLKIMIEGLQVKAVQFFANLCKNKPVQWRKRKIISLLVELKEDRNFRIRQQCIHLITQSSGCMDENNLKQYQEIIVFFLNDKVPNLRWLALNALHTKTMLRNDLTKSSVARLKQDPDFEVQQLAIKLQC